MEANKRKMEGSPLEDVRLPESVEVCIKRISLEKQIPPPKPYARIMLREIGEKASLEILNTILSNETPIESFGGFISYLVKKAHPIQADAVLSRYNSPSSAPPLGTRSPSSATPNTVCNCGSLQPPVSNLQRTGFRKISRQLYFEDETHESRSCIARDVSLRPREHGEIAEPITISPHFNMTISNLSSILFENKLNGENYVSWIRNLNLILTLEGCRFVLSETQHEKTNASSDAMQRDLYMKWLEADESARNLIQFSVEDEFGNKLNSFSTALGIIQYLRERFRKQNREARHLVMGNLLSIKMNEGTPVKDHVLSMMGILSEIELLGGCLDDRSQVDIILHSLPAKFEQFKADVCSLKKDVSLKELLKELLQAELCDGILQEFKETQSLVPVEEIPTNKRKREVALDMIPVMTKEIRVSEGVSKYPCFKCNQLGHWKANCPLNKKGKSFSLVVETCLAACSAFHWAVVTGAIDHVTMSLQRFLVTRHLSEGEINVYLADISHVVAKAVGDVHLSFSSDMILNLKNCLYVSNLRRNLVSVL